MKMDDNNLPIVDPAVSRGVDLVDEIQVAIDQAGAVARVYASWAATVDQSADVTRSRDPEYLAWAVSDLLDRAKEKLAELHEAYKVATQPATES